MILAALLLQASPVQATEESRRLYEPYRQCLDGQRALLAGPDGETAGLDRARTSCMAENLSAGSNTLFAEMRSGLSQAEAIERGSALRREIEQDAVARARAQGDHAASDSTATIRTVVANVTIPDEIAPAIIPYVRCLMASQGIPIRRPGGAAEPPAAAVDANCTPVRQEAARRADAMLVAQHRGRPDERTALIERTLTGVEDFAGASAAPPHEGKPDASN